MAKAMSRAEGILECIRVGDGDDGVDGFDDGATLAFCCLIC